MKIRNMLPLIIMLVLTATELFSQNTNPVITDVELSYDGSTVTITYNLSDAEQSSVDVRLFISEDSGTSWVDETDNASGDVGVNVGCSTTSTQKTITWTYSGSNILTMKAKVLADDKTADGSPCPDVPVVDYGGKLYNTIQIGDQCWLKENLNIGTMVNKTASSGQQTDNGVIEKYCFDNLENNCNTFGGLYEWDEAMQYSTTEGAQGICPSGWHIPTYWEMENLRSYINQEGIKLVATGQTMGGGLTPTNTSGFSALFGGYWDDDNGIFSGMGSYNYFWTSSLSGTKVFLKYICYVYNGWYSGYYDKTYGYSVRCIKD